MKKFLLFLLILGAAAFAWWTISPLFIDKEVNDELPTSVTNAPQERSDVEEDIRDIPETSTPTETSAPTGAPQTTTEGPFAITGTRGHPASGGVKLVRAPDGVTVRYEDYDGTNGPDLYVYLAKDLDAEEFVDLGRAKGNKGNINYSVPESVDVDEYPYVLTWCKAFGVLFDYAEITQ